MVGGRSPRDLVAAGRTRAHDTQPPEAGQFVRQLVHLRLRTHTSALSMAWGAQAFDVNRCERVGSSGVHERRTLMDAGRVGVIFDMDGVLVDSADAHFESWRRMAQELGLKVTNAQFHATFGRQNRDIIPIVFGVTDEDSIQRMADRKEELYRELVRNQPPIVPGSVQLVHGLHRAGARLAVGSSAPRANIELILNAMGIAECISAVVSGDEATRGKPDPQVFSIACEALGIPPARCVVIEDAPAGVQAARAAGAKAVALLLHHPSEEFGLADRIVERLADLSVEQVLALAAGM